MDTSSRAPFYDLFKLIVAILLLLLFLLLIWQRPSPAPLPETPTASTPTLSAGIPSPTATSSTTTVMPPSLPSPTGTLPSSSTATSVPIPSASATPIPTLTPTLLPSPTESPVPETLPTPIVEIPSDTNVCNAISQSQLQVGSKARILRRLNFRASPGIQHNWIKTNIPGTQVEVVGGPTCTRYKNGGAYLWWQIKLPDGQIGWSAEASAFGKFFFMEPVK